MELPTLDERWKMDVIETYNFLNGLDEVQFDYFYKFWNARLTTGYSRKLRIKLQNMWRNTSIAVKLWVYVTS